MNGRSVVVLLALLLVSCDTRTITFATPSASATPFSTPLRTPVRTTAAPTPTPSPTASPTRTPEPSSAAPSASVPPASATPSPSPSTPTLPPGASLPPMPAQPALPSGATVVVSATSAFALRAGEIRRFEPADLARERGATAPACASLVLTVAWRATEPLTGAWYPEQSTSAIDVGRGCWGTFDLGCASFELRNTGSATVVGEIAYTIASR